MSLASTRTGACRVHCGWCRDGAQTANSVLKLQKNLKLYNVESNLQGEEAGAWRGHNKKWINIKANYQKTHIRSRKPDLLRMYKVLTNKHTNALQINLAMGHLSLNSAPGLPVI